MSTRSFFRSQDRQTNLREFLQLVFSKLKPETIGSPQRGPCFFSFLIPTRASITLGGAETIKRGSFSFGGVNDRIKSAFTYLHRERNLREKAFDCGLAQLRRAYPFDPFHESEGFSTE